MSKREDIHGFRLFLPFMIPLLLVLALATLQHPRVIYTSDSTAQQSIVRTWLDVGHGLTFVPRDTWALKIPLYLVLENLPLRPPDRLLAAVLVLNALTFVLLAWAVRRLAGPGPARWYDVALPLAWFAALGGGIGSNRMLTNYRNIELGLCFVMLAVIAGVLSSPAVRSQPARLARAAGAVLLLGLLWFDDPYIELLVAAPLAVAAIGWYFGRERDARLLWVAAVVLASLPVTALLRVVAGWFGIRFADPGHTLAISPADLGRHLELLPPATTQLLGIDRWDGGLADQIAQVLVIGGVVAMILASAALARYGWRQRQFVPAFLGAQWPLVVGGFLVSWHTRDVRAGRYLVLAVCDLVVATAVLLPHLRRHQPRVARALVWLLAVGTAFSFTTGALAAIDAARRPSLALPHQQAVVQAVETAVREHGAVKGYAPFWAANITTYLAGQGTTAAELVCRNGRLATREWLSDTARLTRPARAVFLIWDPQAPSLAGCPASVRDAQLGAPLARYPVRPATVPTPAGGVDAVLVYEPDIVARLGPADDA
jgi:hypothetical protein